jgi:hypothetical protein
MRSGISVRFGLLDESPSSSRSSVERSERNVSIDNIARIAKTLGVEAWGVAKNAAIA